MPSLTAPCSRITLDHRGRRRIRRLFADGFFATISRNRWDAGPERHAVPFACTTNAPELLDAASARRFARVVNGRRGAHGALAAQRNLNYKFLFCGRLVASNITNCAQEILYLVVFIVIFVMRRLL